MGRAGGFPVPTDDMMKPVDSCSGAIPVQASEACASRSCSRSALLSLVRGPGSFLGFERRLQCPTQALRRFPRSKIPYRRTGIRHNVEWGFVPGLQAEPDV